MSDDLFTPTDIPDDIWQGINAAGFVIADITGRNPNVLDKLGIAHTPAKPVLILSMQAADPAIDLAFRRVLLYRQYELDWPEEPGYRISSALSVIVQEYGLTTRRKSADTSRARYRRCRHSEPFESRRSKTWWGA